jgi:hypothetical protein
MKLFLCNAISKCKMNSSEVKHQFLNFGNRVLNFNFETVKGLEFYLILKMKLFGMDNDRKVTIGFPSIIPFYACYSPPHLHLYTPCSIITHFLGKHLFQNMRNGYGGLVFWELVIYTV